MMALVLLSELRRQGVRFLVDGDRLRVIQPKDKPLPDEMKSEIRRYKDEILRRLHSGGVSAEDVAAVFPGATAVREAAVAIKEAEAADWLRSRLTRGPQHIAPLIAEWVGTLDHPTGRDLDDLMQARWSQGVHTYVGEDDRLWWRLPQTMVQ